MNGAATDTVSKKRDEDPNKEGRRLIRIGPEPQDGQLLLNRLLTTRSIDIIAYSEETCNVTSITEYGRDESGQRRLAETT